MTTSLNHMVAERTTQQQPQLTSDPTGDDPRTHHVFRYQVSLVADAATVKEDTATATIRQQFTPADDQFRGTPSTQRRPRPSVTPVDYRQRAGSDVRRQKARANCHRTRSVLPGCTLRVRLVVPRTDKETHSTNSTTHHSTPQRYPPLLPPRISPPVKNNQNHHLKVSSVAASRPPTRSKASLSFFSDGMKRGLHSASHGNSRAIQ